MIFKISFALVALFGAASAIYSASSGPFGTDVAYAGLNAAASSGYGYGINPYYPVPNYPIVPPYAPIGPIVSPYATGFAGSQISAQMQGQRNAENAETNKQNQK